MHTQTQTYECKKEIDEHEKKTEIKISGMEMVNTFQPPKMVMCFENKFRSFPLNEHTSRKNKEKTTMKNNNSYGAEQK